MAEQQPIQIPPDIQKKVNDIYLRELGRTADPSGMQTWGSWLMNGSSESQVVNQIHLSPEYITNVAVPAVFWDKLGRDPQGNTGGWENWFMQQVNSGQSFEKVYGDMIRLFEESEEYKNLGGKEAENVRDYMNVMEFADAYPEFVWGEAQQQEALNYAKAAFGEYYGDLLTELTNAINTQKTRVGEDVTYQTQQITQALNDYVTKTDTEKARINEDYDRAMFQAAEDYGMDKEKIATDILRNAENYKVNTDEIIRRYNKIIPEVIESFANKGMTFSGKRVLEEQYQEGSKAYELAGQQRSYERNLADLNRQETLADIQYGRYTEGAAISKERNLADINSQLAINQRNAAQDIARQGVLAGRTMEDLTLEEQQKRRALEAERQDKEQEMYQNLETEAKVGAATDWQNYLMQYPRFKPLEGFSPAKQMGLASYYSNQIGQGSYF